MLRPLNFKTSYVIVYLKEVDRSQKRYIDFKTSHVIVYQAQKALWIICHKISKHLMLLFIFSTPDIDIWSPGFQNISCYCLSSLRLLFRQEILYFKTSHVIVYLRCIAEIYLVDYFKTSHVIVYRRQRSRCSWYCCISKHLMLLFIPRISAFFSFSPPLFPLIFSIFLHFLPANTLILNRPTYHPINLLIFQAFLDFSFFFRLVKIL